MQLLVILGSRNPKGQTARAAEAVIEGYVQAGGTAERVFLPALTIERCRQCEDSGWGTCRSEAHCVIEDDLDKVIALAEQADAVVFATPVYYGDLAESMRAFTDRLRRCARDGQPRALVGTPAIGVCVAGGGGGGAPNCCVSLEKVISRCGFDVVDMIPVRRQNLDTKAAQLELVGRWLATGPRSK